MTGQYRALFNALNRARSPFTVFSIIFVSAFASLTFACPPAHADRVASPRLKEVNEALDNYERRAPRLCAPLSEKAGAGEIPAVPSENVKFQRETQSKKGASSPAERQKIIDRSLDDMALKIQAGTMFVSGEQTFRLNHTDYEGNLSKLTYPIRGSMNFIGAEGKIWPRISIAGRYASSNFNNETSKDEDWNFWGSHNGDLTFIDYQFTEQNTENDAWFWNADVYYRMVDWDKGSLGENASQNFSADTLYLDAFAGYQYYRGKHTMVDPVTKYERQIAGEWWYVPSVPLTWGLDSWYKVTYEGPRIGLRLGGSHFEKISSSLSVSYAWLTTDSDAYWNLRDFRWHHEGQGFGSGVNVDFEAEYLITRHWFLGGGLHYMWQRQRDLLYSGTQPGSSFNDLDIARDTQMDLWGLSLKIGFRW